METNLLAVCITAFLAVFALLGILAAVMHAITLVFSPPRPARMADPAVVAAITSSVAILYPHMQVTRIKEES